MLFASWGIIIQLDVLDSNTETQEEGQLEQIDLAGTRQLLTADLWDRKLLASFITKEHVYTTICSRARASILSQSGKKAADIITCDITHLNCFIRSSIAETSQRWSVENWPIPTEQ